MEFISKKHIYHGDLATRNILLTDQFVAKVSDFGLSQRLYQSIPPNTPYSGDVGCVKLPMKWLALEVLMHGQATTKSDVWSYGVLVWEILNFGEEPYSPGRLFETDQFIYFRMSFILSITSRIFKIKLHIDILFRNIL